MQLKKFSYKNFALSKLTERHDCFDDNFALSLNPSAFKKWRLLSSKELNHELMISFFGKSGYGKSSTINAITGLKHMLTSDIDACTRRCNCVDYKISPNKYISFCDFPGIGESDYNNSDYLKMYSDFIDYTELVIYIMRADARDFTMDEFAYANVFNSDKKRNKVLIVLNQCDKVEPVERGTWNSPTKSQLININKKIDFIESKFKPLHAVVPYSAATGWNIDFLAQSIVGAIKKNNA